MKMTSFLNAYADRALAMRPKAADLLYRYIREAMVDRHDGFHRSKPGPGGAALATPFSCAFMICAAARDVVRARPAEAAWELWLLKSETNADDFGDVFERILRHSNLAEQVDRVEIFRTGLEARIHMKPSRAHPSGEVAVFRDPGSGAEEREIDGAFRHLAVIGGKTLDQIACALHSDGAAPSS